MSETGKIGRKAATLTAITVSGLLSACSKPAPPPPDTSVWIQKSEVAVKAGDFRGCVAAAVAKIAGLEAVDAESTNDLVRIKTGQSASIPGLRIEVIHTDHNTADVQFIAAGTRETDEARHGVSPKLRELTDAIGAACTAG